MGRAADAPLHTTHAMAPSAFSARDIVSSHAALDGSLPVKELVEWFKQHPELEFAAVFDQGAIIGLASREALNARIAGNKYGFSVLADKPITKVIVEDPMIVEGSLPVSDLVQQLLHKRSGPDKAAGSFYDDIVVHEHGRFLGLASVKQLVVKQMEYILEQMRSLERQQMALAQKNKELFEASLRLSKTNTQFKSFFENCSIPIVVFDDYGVFIQGNPRFLRLIGYSAAELTGQPDEVLFEGGIKEMLDNLSQLQETDGRKPTWYLNLRQNGRRAQGVEVSYEYDADSHQIILSILRLADEADMRVALMLQQRAAQEGGTLFRSVAANLIDRETNAEGAMAKLDAILSYAGKLEDRVAGNPLLLDHADSATISATGKLRLPPNHAVRAQAGSQNLHGSLGQLSIVDMTQLLVQGRKTGELTITDARGDIGVVYIRQGFICHAIMAPLKGTDALRQIMRVEHGSFVFAYDVLPSEVTIQGHDPMGILMDVVSDMDEADSSHEDMVASAG
ncbi:hypothetical protein DB346_09125 [Verrucomicrobia bacterium LW23]|nr:hypothetical protein DB346_09125 [Verrucomicrobia bacterium LW23]